MIALLWACTVHSPGPALPSIADEITACGPAATRSPSLEVRVRVLRGEGVTADEAGQAFALLSGRVVRWGVALEGRRGDAPMPGQLLGSHPEADEDELAPLRRFVDARLRPRRDEVVLGVVRDVVDPRSKLARTVSLEGFGLHPEGLTSPQGRHVREALGDQPFTPFLLIDVDALAQPDRARSVLAHELGHALGLGHQEGEGNAMAEARTDACAESLTAEQLDDLRP